MRRMKRSRLLGLAIGLGVGLSAGAAAAVPLTVTHELTPEALDIAEGWMASLHNVWDRRADKLDAYLSQFVNRNDQSTNNPETSS